MTLTQRRISAEHMDDPQASPQQIREALRFIQLVNRRLGGTAATIRQFRRWAILHERDWRQQQTVRILDVGTGAADIPLAIADWANRSGFSVHITAVDLHPVTVQFAQEHASRRDSIEVVQADALKLMDHFEPGEFHYAHAGMFLHHLQDIEVMTVLRIMDRLTSHGIVWNDLARAWVGRVGVRLLTLPMFGVPAHVRHDARVSIEAGFTRREAVDLAHRAGLAEVKYRRHSLHRFTLASEKQPGS
jgi:ubiquinone/menaquinone biosynthesis C-methylase UbiE